MMKAGHRFVIGLLLVLLLAGWARTLKLDWDEGTHLHPDERYLTMVASALEMPSGWGAYWDTATSPLNPENRGYRGYVYGTLPLFAARMAGSWLDGACGDAPKPLPSLARRLLFHAATPCAAGSYTGYGGIHLVGRLLSACADLLTLVAVALLGRRLFGERVALLAALLYAMAVLPVQHAHFFVVDSFASLFVLWTLVLAALWVDRRQPYWLLLAGLTTGLAAASKISTAPVGLVVAVAALLVPDEEGRLHIAFRPLPLLWGLGGAVLAALAFRAAQPYAFSGPTFWSFRLNPSWKETMRYIRHLMAGDIDAPPGHQWTARAPILFPLENIVFWGMGVPLGVAAWAGWAAMGGWMVHRRRWRPLPLWLWGTAFFFYQATQWVKTMRYFLPIYGPLALFAAWGLVEVLRLGRRRRLWRSLGVAALVIVVAGTFFWLFAFLHIYLRPFTRVEASRWIFANIPTAITVEGVEGFHAPVPVVPETPLRAGERTPPFPFRVSSAMTVESIRLTKVRADGAGMRTLTVRLLAPDGGTAMSVTARVRLDAGVQPVVLTPTRQLPLEAGATYALQLELGEGAPLVLDTSVLGNEHWDDSLPLRLDGRDPFYNWYRGLHSSPDTLMDLYNDDNAAKRDQLLAWLDEVDYIVLSSNRLYASIPRLAQRYPLTTAYYRALFDGRLGFRALAEFVSFPSLGSCQFPDQEMPFGRPAVQYTTALPCSLPWPPAEEAFSVYDHPRVLIFAKTAAYSHERAAALLPLSLAESAVWMTPKEATRHRSPERVLFLSAKERAVQEAGGTWRRLFPPEGLQNRHPWLAAALWWALLTLVGLLAWPWVHWLLPRLHGGGYGLARAAGLLFWAYPAWLLAALHLTVHTRLLLWGMLALFAAASFALLRRRAGGWAALWREYGETALRIEMLFALLFLFWLGVRYLNPDLYHPVAGGEKPMDFAYLNAVLRSSWFPPYDPWFAGAVMNYYYFGFVLVGAPMKALGIDPAIGYNIAIAMLFALTGVGAFTLAATLSRRSGRRAVAAGLWGTTLVLLLGNWGEFTFLFKLLDELGQVHFESWFPFYPHVVSAVVGLWKLFVEGAKPAVRPEWWYWNASRVVPPGPGELVGPINEFPLFTFLYGDLHAHAMALPMVEVALGLVLQWGLRRKRRPPLPLLASQVLFGALLLGTLRAANSWDFPTYLVLLTAAYALPALYTPGGGGGWWEIAAIPAALVAGASLLFHPFLARYLTTYTSFELWDGSRTKMGAFLTMHGQFLLPLGALALVEVRRWWRRLRREGVADPLSALTVALGILALTATLVALDVSIALLVVPFGGLLAAFLLAGPADEEASPPPLLWLLVGAALGLTLMVELVVLKGDLGRMNTVFKFYFQVWLLLGVSAAVAMEFLSHHLLRRAGEPSLRDDLLFGLLAFSLCASALYPLFAIPAKVHDRWVKEAPHTLDGMRFLRYALFYEENRPVDLSEEARVIDWMRLHVDGSPVVMEQNAPVEYVTFGNRISIYTGLPGVVGWRWHQVQQLMALPAGTVEARQDDVRRFYDTPDVDEAMAILRRYGVRYVVLTPYERLRITPEGEAKFAAMVEQGWLTPVYDDGQAQVYRVQP